MPSAKKKRRKDLVQPSSTPSSAAASPAWLVPAAIVSLAFGLRLWGLGSFLPVVGDESIYMRWAEIIDNQGEWFVSLLDGKAPLSYWLYVVARWVIPGDPLLGPRLVSALAGACSTALLYAVGVRLSGETAGRLAACFYAVLPWALLYDRLCYTESLVNLAGIAVFWASLRTFEDPSRSMNRAALLGLVFGLGLFIKSTVMLFSPAPLAIAWSRVADQPLPRRFTKLALVYGLAAFFPLLSFLATPDAPQLEDHSVVFHKTHFFYSPAELAADPLAGLRGSGSQLVAFAGAYLGWPAALAGIGCLAWLVGSRPAVGWPLLAVSIAPLLFELGALTKFFSRYPFPHVWPLLAAIAVAAASLLGSKDKRWIGQALAGGVGLALSVQSLFLLANPRAALAEEDSSYYFGDGPNAGWGLTATVDYIRKQAENGKLLLLVDPIWGTPADAFCAYLNGRGGVRVVEAWWLEEEPNSPLLPSRQVEVWKSHYQRVSGGSVDFTDYSAVYYATLTNYRSRAEVARRQPGARLELSMPKPGGSQSLDLYRLR